MSTSKDYRRALGDILRQLCEFQRWELNWEWMEKSKDGQYIEIEDIQKWLKDKLAEKNMPESKNICPCGSKDFELVESVPTPGDKPFPGFLPKKDMTFKCRKCGREIKFEGCWITGMSSVSNNDNPDVVIEEL